MISKEKILKGITQHISNTYMERVEIDIGNEFPNEIKLAAMDRLDSKMRRLIEAKKIIEEELI